MDDCESDGKALDHRNPASEGQTPRYQPIFGEAFATPLGRHWPRTLRILGLLPVGLAHDARSHRRQQPVQPESGLAPCCGRQQDTRRLTICGLTAGPITWLRCRSLTLRARGERLTDPTVDVRSDGDQSIDQLEVAGIPGGASRRHRQVCCRHRPKNTVWSHKLPAQWCRQQRQRAIFSECVPAVARNLLADRMPLQSQPHNQPGRILSIIIRMLTRLLSTRRAD